MSNIKRNIFEHGGARKGAGRKEGVTKVKLSISVDEKLFGRAMDKWSKKVDKPKTSRLMEKLLDFYATNRVSLEVLP